MKYIIKSDGYGIIQNGDEILIETYIQGLSVQTIANNIINLQEITITSFIAIRKAVTSAPCSPIQFGIMKSNIFVSCDKGDTKAFVKFELPEDQLNKSHRNELISKVEKELTSQKITLGINLDILQNTPLLENKKQYLIAQGQLPTKGRDSERKIISLKEKKPREMDDGSVDHFDLGIINTVEEGDWIGEWTIHQPGIPGKNVFGEIIEGEPGKKASIAYDKKTIREQQVEGKIVLYARKNGSVQLSSSKMLFVADVLVVDNVDYSTGNINYNGTVVIKKSIADGFSVIARDDILIEFNESIGAVKEICSTEGSVLMCCGINGREKAKIYAKKDINVKFAMDCELKAEETINVNKYLMNCKVKAGQIILDSINSQIVGGYVTAAYRISVATLGNISEKKADIHVLGFDREAMTQLAQETRMQLDRIRLEIAKVEVVLGGDSPEIDRFHYIDEKQKLVEKFFSLEKVEKETRGILKLNGNGEVYIGRKIYPGNRIWMGNFSVNVTKEMNETRYCLNSDGIELQ